MKKVYLGKSYKNVKIAKKKPKTGVKIGETQSLRRYAVGANEYVVAKPGVKLLRDWEKDV